MTTLSRMSGDHHDAAGLATEYTDAETGFVYLPARYYDPAMGQFISRDPLVALTGSAYGYVDGNPLNAVDPLGLFCVGGVTAIPARSTSVTPSFRR